MQAQFVNGQRRQRNGSGAAALSFFLADAGLGLFGAPDYGKLCCACQSDVAPTQRANLTTPEATCDCEQNRNEQAVVVAEKARDYDGR